MSWGLINNKDELSWFEFFQDGSIFEPEFLDNNKVKLSATSKTYLTLALDLMMYWFEENITLNIKEANMTAAPFHVIVKLNGSIYDQYSSFCNLCSEEFSGILDA